MSLSGFFKGLVNLPSAPDIPERDPMDSHAFQQDNPAAALEAAVEAEEAGQWKQAYALAAPLSRNLQISQPMRLRAGEVALRAAVAGVQWTDADMVLRVILAQNDPGALRRARAVIVDAPMGADREALIGRLDQAQGSAALRGSELGASLLGDLDAPAPGAPVPPPAVRRETAPEQAAEQSLDDVDDDDDEDFKFEGQDDTEEEAAAWLERARLAWTEQSEAVLEEAPGSPAPGAEAEDGGDEADIGDLSLGMLPRSSLIDDDLAAEIRTEGGRFAGDVDPDGADDPRDVAADAASAGGASEPVMSETQSPVPATPEYSDDSSADAGEWDGDSDPWSDAPVEPEPVRDWTDADIDALEEEFGGVPEVDPLRAGPPPVETSWMAAAMHEPTPGEQDAAEPLPFLDFTEVKPEDVHRIVVSNPGESGREILRRFAQAQAQRTTPAQLLTSYNMGLAFHQMETTDAYEQAVTFLIPAATIDNPDRLGAVEVLARTLFLLDRLEEAHGYLTAAVGANPRDPEYGPIFYWLGKIAEERGRPNEALPYYAHAVALEPSLVEAKRRIRALMG